MTLEFVKNDDPTGTSLQGYVTTTYDKIIKAFGEPTMTDASPYEKVNVQWSMDFKVPFTDEFGEDFDYVKATIYNWKMGYVPTEEYKWHIGGLSNDAVDVINNVLDSY